MSCRQQFSNNEVSYIKKKQHYCKRNYKDKPLTSTCICSLAIFKDDSRLKGSDKVRKQVHVNIISYTPSEESKEES